MQQSIPPKRRFGLSPLERQNLKTGLLFISPWIIGFCVFLAYPISRSIYYSLCDFSVLQPPRFVGLANYQELAHDDVFQKSLYNTVFYAASAIPLGIILAFSIAMLLNTGVKGMAVYRTIFFLPSLIPSIALAILWMWIFNGKYGILNFLLGLVGQPMGWIGYALALASPLLLGWLFSYAGATRRGADSRILGWVVGIAAGVGLIAVLVMGGWIGLGSRGLGGKLANLALSPPNWLSDTVWVKPALIFMSLWSTGQAIVIYLAGLQDVPQHLYEAADLDGANWWQKTVTVTIPMMSPVILFNGIMAIIGTFNFFASPFVMAPGGQPAREGYFLAVNLYDTCFVYLRMGYAAAMAWILFGIVFILTMVAMRLSAKHVHYAGA
jgi:ABC-type sugar transport system permease subunit